MSERAEIKFRAISLGAGVQSTTVALKAARGEIGPMPDCAIMADTEDEGQATYKHLEWLIKQLPFPVYRPSRGRLSCALLEGDEEARIPAFVEKGGLAKRQCTRNFKIRVIRRETRRVFGFSPRGYIAPGTIERWIGISCDEADRMTDSDVRFEVHRYPLIEQKMSRSDCAKWLWDNFKRVVPKSSCVYCAFQSDKQWLERKNSPDDFSLACSVDAGLRTRENVSRFHGSLYLHRSLKPLAEIDFATLVASKSRQGDLFGNECKGVCGV